MSKTLLSARKEIAAQLLAIGKSSRQIADELEVSPQTIYRWSKGEDFLHRQQEWQAQYIAEAREKITRELLPKALDCLEVVLESGSDSSRLSASRFIVQLHGISRIALGKEVAMDDAVFEAAAYVLADIFSNREDLKKEAMLEWQRRRTNREGANSDISVGQHQDE